MPHEITVDARTETVKVVYEGEITIDEWRQWRSQTVQTCLDNGFARILVDQRKAVQRVTTLELYAFGEETAGMLPPHVRVARVIAPHDNNSRFVTTVANNRGLCVRDFTSMTAALEWLA